MQSEQKKKTVEPHVTDLMCSYNYYLQFPYNWLQLIATVSSAIYDKMFIVISI